MSGTTVVTSGCSDGGPATPTAPGAGSSMCRTYATAYRRVQTAVLGDESAELWQMTATCRWDTNRLTCTQQYSQFRGDCEGAPGSASTTVVYRTAADFVDETAVLPPAPKAISQTVTSASGSCPSPSETSYFYNTEGRLIRASTSSAQNFSANSARTYSAWDTAGRPTEGALAGIIDGGAFSTAYDDAARAATETLRLRSGAWVITQRTEYDARGIVVREVLQDSVGNEARPVYTTITTPTATAQVCK